MGQWQSWYPGVSGIFFDEMANAAGHEAYYSGLTAYAKGRGLGFTIGNPGADSSPSYVGTEDVILIYESGGLPSAAAARRLARQLQPKQLRRDPLRRRQPRYLLRAIGEAVRRVHLPAERQPAEPVGQRPALSVGAGRRARLKGSAADDVAIAVVRRAALARAERSESCSRAGGDGDVETGHVAVLGISDQQLRGAGIPVVRAGGRAGGARIAGLSGADVLVTAPRGAVVVIVGAAARRAAAVVVQAGHDGRVGAAARAVGARSARQIGGAGVLVVAGSRRRRRGARR